MATPLTAGMALKAPGNIVSRRRPRVVSAAQARILSYEGLVWAMVPEGGARSESPLVLVDRTGGKLITPAVSAPTINRNASGDGRMGLDFGTAGDQRLVSEFTLPPSYTIVTVLKAPNTASTATRPIASHNDNSGAGFFLWLKQDALGAALDVSFRHGTTAQFNIDQAVPFDTRCIVTLSHDAVAARSAIFVNQATAGTSLAITTPHKNATTFAVGGQTNGNSGFAGTIEAQYIFEGDMYRTYAPHSLNAFRRQFIAEVGLDLGVANTAA